MEYLVFKLQEQFGSVELLKVLEVIDGNQLKGITGAPSFILGNIQKNESDLLVYDLSSKIEGETNRSYPFILVLETQSEDEPITFGIGVNSIEGSISIEQNEIGEIQSNLDVVQGIVKKDNQEILVLDLEKILSEDELDLILELEDKLSLQKNPIEVESMLQTAEAV
ncbi:MAG: purine-binding chemotaxis protein CheW [bacterium]|jgi:purine-binding chemotaxis protein CheW